MPAPDEKDLALLHDMLESARLIIHYSRGIRLEDFAANDEKRDAVSLRLSVMGEAASRVSERTQAALPSIPFTQIRGLRNRLAHDYGAIDFEIVWRVARTDIPCGGTEPGCAPPRHFTSQAQAEAR